MKRALLAVLIIGLLGLAGCAQGPDPNAPGDSGIPFIGGTQGLALSMAEGMPPLEVFDEGQSIFSVGVVVENIGESSVGVEGRNTFGYVELVGINPYQFAKTPGELRQSWYDADITLQGARRGFDGTIIPGDVSLVEFQGLSYTADRFGNADVTVRANVCYGYRTYAEAKVCFKDSLLENTVDTTICELSGARQFSTSAAPIQVTQVTQNPAGSEKIQVTFVIENVGAGALFAPEGYPGFSNSDNICSFNIGANLLRDVVGVTVDLGERDGSYSDDISCPLLGGSRSGYVRLYQGAPATITCTIRTDNTATRIFTDSFLIEMDYTYLDFVETPLLIRDTNVGFVEPGVR